MQSLEPSQNQGPQRIVVLGGGFGGLAFCQALNDPRFAITLVDRRNHHLFQPLLYQVATAGLSAPEIAQPIRSIFARQKNVTVLMDNVLSIDAAQRRVVLKNRELAYDFLVVGLGAKTGYFGHPEWEVHAPGLKSLEDAVRIRREVLLAYEQAEMTEEKSAHEKLLTTVVVGGGPTGVEMAGALSELAHKALKGDFRHVDPSQARIILVEAGPRILPMFADDLSDYAAKRLAKMGVQVRTNCAVQDMGDGWLVCGGEKIAAANVIWAAGVEASPVAKSLGCALDRAGRIQVEPDLSIPGHPEIFAIGDIVSLTDKNGVRVPGVAPAAAQMGKHAAKVILDEIKKHRGRKFATPIPRPAFAYWDKGSMATIGRSAAVAAAGKFKFRGLLAWGMWLFIHLLFLVGMRNRIAVFFQWVYHYLTYRRGARIITGEVKTEK